MSLERVKEFVAQHGMEDRIQEFDVSSATVELAAAALHCESARIAKTLSFLVNGGGILIVAAGDARIDNQKYKAQFGVKARMIPAEQDVYKRQARAAGFRYLCTFEEMEPVFHQI